MADDETAQADVLPIELGPALNAAAAALAESGVRDSWVTRVSVTVARRVDGVDVETEHLWEMDGR